MNIKVLFATVVAGTALFAAPLAFADEGAHADAGLNLGLHQGELVHGKVHGEDSAKIDQDDDDDAVQATGTAPETEQTNFRSHILGGVVTSIAGNAFTIDPFGPAATATVTTDSNTTFKGKDGATSTSALSVGSRVLVFGNLVSGSTTASSSASSETFAAALVKILGNGFGHFRAWLGLGGEIR